jgi:nucleoside-diphosphate-sugar epimerase
VRVLVTGADGYVGCPFAPTLFEDGHDIVAQADDRLSRKGR